MTFFFYCQYLTGLSGWSFPHLSLSSRFLPIVSKHAVETIETFDFLREIVEAVPDPSAGGTIDLEAEARAEGKKKRRSKKAADAVVVVVAEGEGEAAAPKRRRKKKKADTGEEEGEGVVPDTSDKGKTGSERVIDQDAEMYDPEDDPEEEGGECYASENESR